MKQNSESKHTRIIIADILSFDPLFNTAYKRSLRISQMSVLVLELKYEKAQSTNIRFVNEKQRLLVGEGFKDSIAANKDKIVLREQSFSNIRNRNNLPTQDDSPEEKHAHTFCFSGGKSGMFL